MPRELKEVIDVRGRGTARRSSLSRSSRLSSSPFPFPFKNAPGLQKLHSRVWIADRNHGFSHKRCTANARINKQAMPIPTPTCAEIGPPADKLTATLSVLSSSSSSVTGIIPSKSDGVVVDSMVVVGTSVVEGGAAVLAVVRAVMPLVVVSRTDCAKLTKSRPKTSLKKDVGAAPAAA